MPHSTIPCPPAPARTVLPVVVCLAILLSLVGAPAAHAQSAEQQFGPNAVDTVEAPVREDTSAARAAVRSLRAWARKRQIVGRLKGTVDGWYPRFGGITRGSGFAAGPGYRGPAGPFYVDASAAMSVKGYTATDLRARWLTTSDDRVELWTAFRYEDFPEEDFFGIGMTSRPEARTSFSVDSTELRTELLVKPRPWAKTTAAVGYVSHDVGRGTDGDLPSIEERFTEAQAPGLLAQPDFLHATFGIAIDFRDTAGNTSSGGLYSASYGLWNDVTEDRFDFHRFDVRLAHFVPLTPDRRHVLSGRLGTSYVNNEPGHQVPFYFLASVGGMDTIRSFREFRFQDENALWMNVEYEWRPIPALSLAAFGDAGQVRADWKDIDLRGLKTGYGFGVGVHMPSGALVRVDAGTGGGEGWQVFFTVRPAF